MGIVITIIIVLILIIIPCFKIEWIKGNPSMNPKGYNEAKEEDFEKVKYIINTRFNIEFEINDDYSLDALKTLDNKLNFPDNQIATFTNYKTGDSIVLLYMGKSPMEELKNSKMSSWVTSITKLGDCYYRKCINEKMIMYGVSLNNEAFTISINKQNIQNEQNIEKCALKIIQTMKNVELVNIEDNDLQKIYFLCTKLEKYCNLKNNPFRNLKFYYDEDKKNLTKQLFIDIQNIIRKEEFLNKENILELKNEIKEVENIINKIKGIR